MGISTSSVGLAPSDNECYQLWIIPTMVFPHLCVEAESINIEIDTLLLILT